MFEERLRVTPLSNVWLSTTHEWRRRRRSKRGGGVCGMLTVNVEIEPVKTYSEATTDDDDDLI